MNTKTYLAEPVAASADGTASWVVATLNVVDADGDVALPGAFGRQEVTVLAAHESRQVPIGKGVVFESGDELIADVKFNLAVPLARDWHSAIRFDLENPPALQEYSYGYDILPGGSRRGELGGRPVQFFRPLPDGRPGVDVIETSPVLRGAGIATRTLAAKRRGGDVFQRACAAEYERFRAAVTDDETEFLAYVAARWGL